MEKLHEQHRDPIYGSREATASDVKDGSRAKGTTLAQPTIAHLVGRRDFANVSRLSVQNDGSTEHGMSYQLQGPGSA